MSTKNRDIPGPSEPKQSDDAARDQIDVERDIARLERSGHWLAIFWIVLLFALLGVAAVTLFDYFQIQQETTLPSVVRAVYPATDNVPVYSEPTPLAPAVDLLKPGLRVFEVQKVPGFAKVEWVDAKARDYRSGWVESGSVKPMIDIIALADDVSARARLTLKVEMDWQDKDLLLNGEVYNGSEFAVRDIRVDGQFLDDRGAVAASDSAVLHAEVDLPAGESAEFTLRAAGVLEKITMVAYEIYDFEPLAPPEPPAPEEGTPGEGAPEGETPAPEGAAPAAPAGN
jgi:hypothetical protein